MISFKNAVCFKDFGITGDSLSAAKLDQNMSNLCGAP